jgi:hypothetical protein
MRTRFHFDPETTAGETFYGVDSCPTKLKRLRKLRRQHAKTSRKAIDATRDVGGWPDRIFGKAIEHTVSRFWTDRAMASRIEAPIYDWSRPQAGARRCPCSRMVEFSLIDGSEYTMIKRKP